MPETVYDRAKQAAATAQVLAVVAFGIITVTLAINFGVATFRTLAAMPDASVLERIRATMTIFVSILPAVLFMSALARLRTALGEYEKGEFFSPRSARAVRKAGEEAFAAMLAQMLIVPAILAGIDSARQVDFHYELVDLAILAFVLFVAAVGRVLDLAVAIKAENDQIV